MSETIERDHRRRPPTEPPLKAIEALTRGLVDYAGLFPPAGEDMRRALENFGSYLRGGDRRSLARFIVPLARLPELEEQSTGLIEGGGSELWRLSVLVPGQVPQAIEAIVDFNRRHEERRGAMIDVVELKATTPDEVTAQSREVPAWLTSYFEIPVSGNIDGLVDAIGATGRRAKIRTGGVTPDAFPRAEAVIDFIVACRRAGVPFKATAGLHHPLRGEYRLTYEPDSHKWMMYGYLNVFLAAALLHAGENEATAVQVLEECDPAAIAVGDDAIVWRDKSVSTAQIQASREFAISFGSCSFREPIDELRALTRHQTRASQ
jgi:hypothetical protein